MFDVPLAEITDVIFPWYYFGGGVKLRAAGEPYRVSFVLPNGAEYAAARGAAAGGDPAALAIVAQKAADIGAGRGVGRQWRRLLEGATALTAPHRGCVWPDGLWRVPSLEVDKCVGRSVRLERYPALVNTTRERDA